MTEIEPTDPIPAARSLDTIDPGHSGRPPRSKGERVLTRIAIDRPLLLVALIAALIVIMGLLRPNTFLTFENGAVVLQDTAQTGILACGMMLLLISGMFDLSIGGILAFSGIVAALVAKDMGMPPIVAFLAGCAWGALLGVVNGVIVTRFKINALIATLATVSIYRGLLQLVSGAGVTNIGNGYTVFGQTQILGIYSSFWFMAVIVLLFAFLVGRTRYFRQSYYIGGNARAAKLSGINVDRTVFVAFVIMGLLAGLAGALLASRLNTAVVLAGNGVELKVITAVVLGGASLAGGVGRISGAFLGVLFMALVQNAMIIAGINPFWQLIAVGFVLLLSVGLDQFAGSGAAFEDCVNEGGVRAVGVQPQCDDRIWEASTRSRHMRTRLLRVLMAVAIASMAGGQALAQGGPTGLDVPIGDPSRADQEYVWISNASNLPLFVERVYPGLEAARKALNVKVRIAGPTSVDTAAYHHHRGNRVHREAGGRDRRRWLGRRPGGRGRQVHRHAGPDRGHGRRPRRIRSASRIWVPTGTASATSTVSTSAGITPTAA